MPRLLPAWLVLLLPNPGCLSLTSRAYLTWLAPACTRQELILPSWENAMDRAFSVGVLLSILTSWHLHWPACAPHSSPIWAPVLHFLAGVPCFHKTLLGPCIPAGSKMVAALPALHAGFILHRTTCCMTFAIGGHAVFLTRVFACALLLTFSLHLRSLPSRMLQLNPSCKISSRPFRSHRLIRRIFSSLPRASHCVAFAEVSALEAAGPRSCILRPVGVWCFLRCGICARAFITLAHARC